MTSKKTDILKRNLLMIEANRCIGCQTCAVACKMEHDLPQGPQPIRAIPVGPLPADEGLIMQHMPATCYHCDQAACVLACPTGAMQKRDDGIVFSDLEICIGCQTCAVACPFGHPKLNPDDGKIAKCDLCRERVDQGLWPSCVLKCPTDALSFGSPQRVVHQRRIEEALRVVQTFSKC